MSNSAEVIVVFKRWTFVGSAWSFSFVHPNHTNQ